MREEERGERGGMSPQQKQRHPSEAKNEALLVYLHGACGEGAGN